MFLFDTDIVSETRKPWPHGGVIAWLASVDESQIFLSAVSIGEIQRGIELTRQQDPQKVQELSAWLEAIIESQSILPMGPEPSGWLPRSCTASQIRSTKMR
ncbi:MAG: hypothetical protein Q4D19_11465 [Lautropia sp.]|nr:hypothetical protein [Lautropia sp.]